MSDLIDRQAALEVIDAVLPVDPMKSEYAQGIACGAALAKTYVEQLPSVQPERKMGKWNFIGDQMFECTECGTCYTQGQFHQMRVRITDSEFPKFCPNCGADMRGEQDDKCRQV